MTRRGVLPALIAVALLLGGAASLAAAPGADPETSAGAVAIRVVVPGQPDVSAASVATPPNNVASGGFAYPGDGSAVSAASVAGSVAAASTPRTLATASSEVTSLSLFRGEVTADSVSARAAARGEGTSASGDFDGSAIANLVVLGQPAPATPGARVTLGDWGYAVLLLESTESRPAASGAERYTGMVTALDVHLTADHGGLPAGTEIVIGVARSTAESAPPPSTETLAPAATISEPAPAAPAATTPAGPTPTTETQAAPTTTAEPPTVEPGHDRPEPKPARKRSPKTAPVLPPPDVAPHLTTGGYVFPVYGAASYSDTFGAPRADVSWHHGDDIFAPLGAPILAVADGTVFSVGWNDVGGNRLWLRDEQGNEFYYAHLSAFSTLAVNGAHVRAGAVLGFVGNTGDAATTPYHLHFEIHPVTLLFEGYDGVINPTKALDAWRRLQDLRFTNVDGWSASVVATSSAPKPGAFLIQSTDISSASGLDPGSLQRALDGSAAVGPAGPLPPVGASVVPPAGDLGRG